MFHDPRGSSTLRNMHVAGAGPMADVDVECKRCGVRMTAYLGSGKEVRYFRCGGCHRWVSSMYREVFRADAHVRMRKPVGADGADESFGAVKARLERWLNALEDQDPYRVLGL